MSNTTSGILTRFFRRRLAKRPAPSPKPSEPQYLLGLSAEQVQHLRQLRSTPSWPHYLEALSRDFETEATKLFSGLSHDAYLHQLGVVHGIESAIGLIERIDAHAQQTHEHAGPARAAEPPHHFFGSDWFTIADRLRKPRIHTPD